MSQTKVVNAAFKVLRTFHNGHVAYVCANFSNGEFKIFSYTEVGDVICGGSYEALDSLMDTEIIFGVKVNWGKLMGKQTQSAPNAIVVRQESKISEVIRYNVTIPRIVLLSLAYDGEEEALDFSLDEEIIETVDALWHLFQEEDN